MQHVVKVRFYHHHVVTTRSTKLEVPVSGFRVHRRWGLGGSQSSCRIWFIFSLPCHHGRPCRSWLVFSSNVVRCKSNAFTQNPSSVTLDGTSRQSYRDRAPQHVPAPIPKRFCAPERQR